MMRFFLLQVFYRRSRDEVQKDAQHQPKIQVTQGEDNDKKVGIDWI